MKRIFLVVFVLTFLLTTSVFAADNFKEMFTQGSVRGDIKVLDFTRDFETANTRKDVAIGGLLYYKTAPLYGVSFGMAFGTSNDLASDDDDSVYSLLGADENGNHVSFTRKQEYYVQGEWFNTKIKYGAQEINTPYLNTDNVRMMPRTYKGLSVTNKSLDSLALSAYYITGSMGWNDDEFVSLSDAVAKNPGGASYIKDDKNLIILGAAYTIPVQAMKADVQGWYYTMEDVFNLSYLKASFSMDAGSANLYFIPSILYQKSQGDELNGEFSTSQMGFRAGVKIAGFDIMGAYAKTGDDGMLTPWGFDKIVAQQYMTSSTRGDENAWGAKITYDFANIGLKGLSTYVFYAYYDVDETDTVRDVAETDFNIQYAFSGALKGLGLRFRYADINVDGGESLTDTRMFVTYSFEFAGK